MMKNILITHGTSQLGLQLIKQYLYLGHRVVAIDKKTTSLEEYKNSNSRFKNNLFILQGDVTSPTSYQKIIRELKSFDFAIDIWINYSGHQHIDDFLNQSVQKFNEVFNHQFQTMANGMRFGLPLLQNNPGSLMANTASLASTIPTKRMSAYVASKHAIWGLTKAVDLELKEVKSKTQLCLIVPGFMDHLETLPFLQNLRELHLLQSTSYVAKEMIEALKNPRDEIYIGPYPKIFQEIHRLFPQIKNKATKFLWDKDSLSSLKKITHFLQKSS